MTAAPLPPDQLPVWLTVLRSAMPASGCLLLGAGNGTGPLVQWLAKADIPCVCLVESAPSLHQHLQRHLPEREGWTVRREVVSAGHTPTTYHEMNLQSASGLYTAEALQALWPHLKQVQAWTEDHPVTLGLLLSEMQPRANWLMIDCLGGDALLEGVALDTLDVVLARAVVPQDADVPESLRLDAMALRLQLSGLTRAVAFEDRHPAIALVLWVRDIPSLRDQMAQGQVAEVRARERVMQVEQAIHQEKEAREQALLKLAASQKELEANRTAVIRERERVMQLEQVILQEQQGRELAAQKLSALEGEHARLQRSLDEALASQHEQLIDACVSTDDLHQRVERALSGQPLHGHERFDFLVGISDRLRDRGDRLTALSYLEQARLGLSGISPAQLETCINRLVSLGQAVAAEQLFTQAVLDGLPPLSLSESDREALKKASQQKHDAFLHKSEHGHDLLLAALKQCLPAYLADISPRRAVLIEIGSTREDVPGQGSTRKLGEFCHRQKLDFVTVDMDPHNSHQAERLFAQHGWSGCRAITMKGEEFLRQHAGPIDFVFLDAYDFDHGQHSELRQSRYQQFLGSRITDAECHRMHLDCATTLAERLEPQGLLCMDDTWLADGRWAAKGTLAMPYLLEHGFEVVEARNRAALLRRVRAGAAPA